MDLDVGRIHHADQKMKFPAYDALLDAQITISKADRLFDSVLATHRNCLLASFVMAGLANIIHLLALLSC